MRTGAIVGLALFWTVTAGAQGGGQATGAAKEQTHQLGRSGHQAGGR